jgi:hypothetical protein
VCKAGLQGGLAYPSRFASCPKLTGQLQHINQQRKELNFHKMSGADYDVVVDVDEEVS